MRNLRILILLFSILCLERTGKSQDAFFSQFYANRLYLNPAWAGLGEEKRVFLNYRNQYPGIGSVYNTYTVSYDQFVEKLYGGIGFSLSNDVQGSGAMNQLSFSGMYSYQFKASRSLSFSGGLQVSAISRSIRVSEFVFGDQYDNFYDPGTGQVGVTEESTDNLSKIFPDFSAGVAAFHNKYFGGISVFHLLKPFQSVSELNESRLSRKLTLFAGTYIPVYERRLGREVLQLNPNFIYIQQKDLSQLIYGLETLYQNRYVAGIWLRQNFGLKYSSLIFSFGVSLDNIRLRYSYDSQFARPSVQIPRMGAHEISMIIAFGEDKKIKHKTIKCPNF